MADLTAIDTPRSRAPRRLGAALRRPRMTRRGDLPEAGDLLALEALYRNGMAITSEGALVRIIRVTPPNPYVLSQSERERTAAAFGQLVSRLRPGQSLQFYVEARPVNLSVILDEARREVEAWAGPAAPSAPPVGLEGSRWRLYDAMAHSLRQEADEQAAVDFAAYVVVPYVPDAPHAHAIVDQVRRRRLPSAPLDRELSEHRRAVRASRAQVETVRGELEGLNLPTHVLNGDEFASLLWARFNPTRADRGRRPAFKPVEIRGELDAPMETAEAREAALKLRDRIARSALDFKASDDHAIVEQDLEQTIYASSTAHATEMGWLIRAMTTRQPFTLSVFAHALDRRRERTRVRLSFRRDHAMLRGQEARGRVPDPDSYAKEAEQYQLLQEMSSSDRTTVSQISIYQSIRARGPEPDPATLAEAVDWCREELEASSDAKVVLGKWQQEQLWETSLPLGRDVARRVKRYATRNVGDMVPLVGTRCGSPNGIPFAFSQPGRELQHFNPWDRAHHNGMCTVTGQSGSGKTLTLNMLLGRATALGARGFVIDRAGHFSTLVELIDGAREITLGADDEHWAINPWDVADPATVPSEKVTFLISLHAVMMGEEGLTVLERSQLGAAIRAVYAKAAALGEMPRESLLRDELLARSELERAGGAAEIAALLRTLAERLGEFCDRGAYAYLLDRPTNVPEESPLVVFDTRRVPEVILAPVMFATLEHITRRVEAHRDANTELAARPDAPLMAGKTVFMCDEGWHLIGRAETGEYTNLLSRRSRHLGMALIFATQQLSDLDTEHGRALLSNATQHLFLSQSSTREVAFAREAVNLTEQEAAIIRRLRTVKGSHAQCYWINGTRGRGQVDIRLGAIEQWAFTSDPIRDVPRRAAAIAAHGGDAWAAIHALAGHGAPSSDSGLGIAA